jgi:hypothetical protein
MLSIEALSLSGLGFGAYFTGTHVEKQCQLWYNPLQTGMGPGMLVEYVAKSAVWWGI